LKYLDLFSLHVHKLLHVLITADLDFFLVGISIALLNHNLYVVFKLELLEGVVAYLGKQIQQGRLSLLKRNSNKCLDSHFFAWIQDQAK
jgi:hypothetical protein